ncbi:MFS transporter [Actinoplanes sp. NPDC051411]|uniref:MFS transporter n=1 Tax=Actinoplanes sp. NPDC051411 TaxID=3155522 RepID=UPI003434A76D
MRRAPALSFLLATVFIDMLGLGLIVPMVPALMGSVTHDPAHAALWSGPIDASYGILQFLTAPLLGRLADRYGRRPVLLRSLGFLGVDYLAHAVNPTIASLMLFHGLAGAFAGTGTVVNAYVADVTPPAGRARAYGLIGAVFSLGFVAGPALGGLLGAADLRLPFVVAALLAFTNVAYGRLVLPESRPGDRITPIGFHSPFGALSAVLRRPVLGRLAAARFCSDIARNVQQALWTFLVTFQLGWGTARTGLVMAVGALAGALFSARAIGPVVRVLGDKRAAVLGAGLSTVAFTGTAFATSGSQIYLMQAIGVLSGIGSASAQSWISRVTGSSEQGTVQGALTSGAALAEAVIPALASALFAWSLPLGFPGLPFLAAGVFASAGAVLLALTRPPVPVS